MSIRIDVVSDTVCPWCFVGKRRLEQAMAKRPEIDFDVHWHPFQLNENVPEDGVDRDTFYREKFGGHAQVKGITEQLTAVGKTMDIDFDFAAIKVQPNTRLSHVLIDLAEGEAQSAVKENLLSAFFEHGKDIGNQDVLVDIGQQAGLSEDMVRRGLQDPGLLKNVEDRSLAARSMGISGVPTFIFNRSQGFSGAQDEQHFLTIFDQLEKQPGPTPP